MSEAGPNPYTFLALTLYLYSFLGTADFLMKLVLMLSWTLEKPLPSPLSSCKTYSVMGEFPEATPPTLRTSQ